MHQLNVLNNIMTKCLLHFFRRKYVPEGTLGYFLGGYVPPGTPNWHPVLKKFPLKLIPRSRNGPIFYTPF